MIVKWASGFELRVDFGQEQIKLIKVNSIVPEEITVYSNEYDDESNDDIKYILDLREIVTSNGKVILTNEKSVFK